MLNKQQADDFRFSEMLLDTLRLSLDKSYTKENSYIETVTIKGKKFVLHAWWEDNDVSFQFGSTKLVAN